MRVLEFHDVHRAYSKGTDVLRGITLYSGKAAE